MPQISIVIITRNEALNIVDCILSAKKLSNDIMVVDSGSTDATVLLAEREYVKTVNITWKGYGHARNTGAMMAENDWILSLDADERITDELAESINALSLNDPEMLYGFRRINFFGHTRVQYGALAHDRVFRLYNKHCSRWNLVPVHERLIGENAKRITLKPKVMHYGIRTKQHYYQKKMGYASLCALKYLYEGKKHIGLLYFLSPAFNFMKAYIFQLGIMDGQMGFVIAKVNAQYTRKKYERLQALLEEEKLTPEYSFIRNSVRKIISFLS